MRSSVSPTMFSPLITLIIAMAAALTPPAAPFPHHFDLNAFHQCLDRPTTNSSGFWPPTNPKFFSVLNSTAENTKCLEKNVPKPLLIVTPYTEAEVQTAVICATMLNVHMLFRSGGHDYECLSYASFTGQAFIVLDLQNLRNVTVDLETQTAWVQAGTTLGELYFHISNASDNKFGFAAGLCTTIGVAGNFLGGGYGMMMRQHGLAADNVVDARLLTADGRILDRKSMGEDVFWALRGGAGGSFGVLLAWKVQLLQVPNKVTVFTAARTLENQGIEVLQQWQTVAHTTDPRLFMRVLIQTVSPSPGYESVMTLYNSMFLGSKSDLLGLMGHSFPELNLTSDECKEVSWIEAVVYMAGYPPGTTPQYLLERKPSFINSFKSKSDYIHTPISKEGLQGLCDAVGRNNRSLVIFTPYGGEIARIRPDQTPFPHRGALFMAQYVGQWSLEDPLPETQANSEKWVRDLYANMTSFVSKNPREAYANYRDLDLGRQSNCWNCSCAYKWGPSYFGNNFWRLVKVKSMVDPFDLFHHEQSIPTYSTLWKCVKLVS